MKNIAIIGSGSWGTALALVANRAANDVIIWSRNKEICYEINSLHTNQRYLPDIYLDENICATNNLADVTDKDILLLSVPAQSIRQLCTDLRLLSLQKSTILVVCSKGIEQESLMLMSEVIEEILPSNPVAILSGPNFAHEVARNLPTIASIAAKDIKLSQMLSGVLSNLNFRIYPNDDMVGTQIFAAAKNVLAIATGIVIGKELGENAKASIVSRGVHEINELSRLMGGRIETLLSPCGVGDIHLTCSSVTSRNMSLGIAIAKMQDIPHSLAEGFYTAKSLNSLALKLKVDMPICQAVYQVINQNIILEQAIEALLLRPLKK